MTSRSTHPYDLGVEDPALYGIVQVISPLYVARDVLGVRHTSHSGGAGRGGAAVSDPGPGAPAEGQRWGGTKSNEGELQKSNIYERSRPNINHGLLFGHQMRPWRQHQYDSTAHPIITPRENPSSHQLNTVHEVEWLMNNYFGPTGMVQIGPRFPKRGRRSNTSSCSPCPVRAT